MEFDFRFKGGDGSIRWTASDFSAEAAKELPYIELVEYEQTFSATLANINYWLQRVQGGFEDAYKGLYLGRPTDNRYILPFFMDSHHNVGQAWQEHSAPLGPLARKGLDFVENVAKVVYPAAGIIYPKAYAGADHYSYDLQFSLLNTIDEQGVLNNKRFLETFIKQNLHVQHNVLTITPPCLYEIYVPGVRWSPVAVISNLTIVNRGTLNRIPAVGGGNYIVPDAWEVRIQMQELINESRKIYEDAIQGREYGSEMTVKVIDQLPAFFVNQFGESLNPDVINTDFDPNNNAGGSGFGDIGGGDFGVV